MFTTGYPRQLIIPHPVHFVKPPFSKKIKKSSIFDRLHIKASFGLELPIRTIGESQKRRGFTPQKPVTRAYQRSDAAVQDCLENKFPVIKKQAKAEDADIV